MWNRLRVSALPRLGVLAFAGAVAFVPSGIAGAQATPARSATVAVMEFESSAMVRPEQFAAITTGLQVMLASALQTNPNVRVVERTKLDEVIKEQNLGTAGRLDPATAARVGKLIGAGHMLFGTIVVQPDMETRLMVRSINSETGALEYSETVVGKGDKIFNLLDQLATKLNSGLKLPGDRDRDAAKQEGLDGPNQLEAITAIHAAERYKDKGDYKSAAEYLQKALKLNPAIGYARRDLATIERRTP